MGPLDGRQPETKEASEEDQWHRKFAMSCNNRAWELSVEDRTPAQDSELLQLAHASAWHWSRIGSELNQMRAKMLVAAVHAELGLGSSALRFAHEMRDYFSDTDTADWEIAFVHTVHAHAAFAAGAAAEHGPRTRSRSRDRGRCDKEDREVVEKSFDGFLCHERSA
jgi:hypothetical protein